MKCPVQAYVLLKTIYMFKINSRICVWDVTVGVQAPVCNKCLNDLCCCRKEEINVTAQSWIAYALYGRERIWIYQAAIGAEMQWPPSLLLGRNRPFPAQLPSQPWARARAPESPFGHTISHSCLQYPWAQLEGSPGVSYSCQSFKPAKSRTMVLKKDKMLDKYCVLWTAQEITSITEKPVKWKP